MEQKSTEHDKALDELSDRLMNIHYSPDSGTGVADRIKECLQEIDGVRSEARSAMCLANDVEQYIRRHNIRIRGLPTKEEQDCRMAVVTFLNDKLCMSVTAEDVALKSLILYQRDTALTLTQINKFSKRTVHSQVGLQSSNQSQ